MWESLQHLDVSLFRLINMGWSNEFFDAVLPLWRNKYFWTPIYVFLITLIILEYKKKSLFIIAGVVILIGLSDVISSDLIKKNVKRTRPCQDELLSSYAQVRVHCGSGYSMTSSHATNHMALAVFLCLTLGTIRKKLRWPLILWALSIGFGQIYVGVHYPGDVFFGFIVGALIGWVVAFIFRRIMTASDGPKTAVTA